MRGRFRFFKESHCREGRLFSPKRKIQSENGTRCGKMMARRIGWLPQTFPAIIPDLLMHSLLEKLARQPEPSIVFFSLAPPLAGNWIMPLTDRDEVRFAEASREMLQRGDYVVPYFNGNYRFDKPILIYWCQSTSYRIFGDNDFAARFPSA